MILISLMYAWHIIDRKMTHDADLCLSKILVFQKHGLCRVFHLQTDIYRIHLWIFCTRHFFKSKPIDLLSFFQTFKLSDSYKQTMTLTKCTCLIESSAHRTSADRGIFRCHIWHFHIFESACRTDIFESVLFLILVGHTISCLNEFLNNFSWMLYHFTKQTSFKEFFYYRI